ncbi:MAG: hypothetical protein LUH05_03540 [Candidatus Gastranaerophilales bacterium]|nr:hypothetical protein [Candidatus Gastranaerophilales bacterium]
MDISGVDVDYLNDEEILELCSDIVDSNNEEIFVLNGIDVNNLSDDKVQEIYDNIISLNSVPIQYEQETSEINNDIVDQNSDEILLINGYNVNFENLSDDEILTYYEDIIDNGDLISYDTTTYKCYDYSTSSGGTYMICSTTYGSQGVYVECASIEDPAWKYCHSRTVYKIKADLINGNLKSYDAGNCYFTCTGYMVAYRICYINNNALNLTKLSSNTGTGGTRYAPILCK